MSYLPESITRLIEEFCQLPGIGPKTAERLTFHLLRAHERKSQNLGQALIVLKEKIRLCESCYNFCNLSPCEICASNFREKQIICVVEQPLDVVAIEKTHIFKGLYHVLHGVISPIDGLGPKDLKISELLYRVKNSDPKIDEIILATNLSLEGEATAQYIFNDLHPFDIKITRIAKGLPVGGNVEYADNITLSNALKGRKEF